MIWLWVIGYILLCIVNLFLWMLFIRLEDGWIDFDDGECISALVLLFLATPISFLLLVVRVLIKYGGKLLYNLVEIMAERIEGTDEESDS